MNDLMRRMLFLPDQASTFAVDVDHLHYFVIIVTMVSSLAVGLTAIAFFRKYRRRRENPAPPFVGPTGFTRCPAVRRDPAPGIGTGRLAGVVPVEVPVAGDAAAPRV